MASRMTRSLKLAGMIAAVGVVAARSSVAGEVPQATIRAPGHDSGKDPEPQQSSERAAPNTAERGMNAKISWWKELSSITPKSNGQATRIGEGGKITVFLDDDKYPVRSLRCEPQGILKRYPMEDPIQGPDRYPIAFVATRRGRCVLRSGDFAMTIVVFGVPADSANSEPSINPNVHLSAREQASWDRLQKINAQITIESSGRTFVFGEFPLLQVFLDRNKYPVRAMTCEPQGVVDVVPGMPPVRGPERYPIGLTAKRPGSCVLRNKELSWTIVVPKDFQRNQGPE
jgi:hypothetical protein